jgi:hypothetical protein
MIPIERRSEEPVAPQNDRPGDRWTQGSIVSQAAAVLAEEVQSLAAGSLSRLSTLVRAGTPSSQAPVEELRGQARALVDTFVRVLGQGPDGFAHLLRENAATARTRDGGNTETVLSVQAPRSVPAGDVAYVSLRLMNDDAEKDECALVATDLIGVSGHRIPASHVRVSPNPASIPAEGSTDVQVEVRVPSGTQAGCYSGLLQADDGESVRALVHVTVNG